MACEMDPPPSGSSEKTDSRCLPEPGAVLLHENKKSDPILIDVSTREKMEAGLKWLFWHLYNEWTVYTDLDQADSREPLEQEMAELRDAISKSSSKTVAVALQTCLANLQVQYNKATGNGRQRKLRLYAKAKENDVQAIAELLHLRRNYEYENWSIVSLIDPTVVREEGAPPSKPEAAPGE